MDNKLLPPVKPLHLKYVKKFTLERLKRIRERNLLSNNEAGTSNVAKHKSTLNLSTSKATETLQRVYLFETEDKYKHIKPKTLTTSLRNKQFQDHLKHHQYTDVVGEQIELKNMANDNNEQTKPLTQPIILQKPKIQPKYDVHRDVLTHEVVIKQTGYGARDKSIPYGLKQCWQGWSFLAIFTGVLPILQWLPKYSLKRDLLGDLIAGFTVAVMHIPHGMAYGLLAGVSPGNGLYMAIFPSIVYMILGTSKHISMGTFSVISMMTLKVVQTYATEENDGVTGADVITPIEIATSLAFTVGIVHIVMAFFRLGTLSSLLSDPLVNGFTTAAACHVVASQLKDVIGVVLPRHKGAFKIVKMVVDFFIATPHTNLVTLGFCISVIVFMSICNECLKPCLRKHCRFPFPAELIAVIGGTLISKFCDLNGNYDVKLVGPIPVGLPEPTLPRWDLIPLVATDSIAIAIVSYSIIMSMSLTFAKKLSYEVRPNQELFALGISNFVGGCFACIPNACSLSRSLIQEQAGGVTQLASLVSSGLILMTILWTGPFFAVLPRCVLAGVVIVALKPMFMQAKELKKFFKQGKLEVLTWLCTFFAVVLIDIDIGLLIGVSISLLTLYIKGLKPYSGLLGIIPEAPAIYVDMRLHRNAVDVPDTKIFRYTGSLNFATNMFFRRSLYDALGLDTQKIRRASYMPVAQNGDVVNGGGKISTLGTFHFLILDFSMLGHVDVAGCHTLSDIMKELSLRDVRLFLASPVDRVYDTIVHSMALGEGPFEIFPTLHDAVEYANAFRTV
ncbi:solute carrier family 26 member 10-like [Teleopsis dalmanni]|uniref:solute carrier family 26 member 10-like n=1 Tax=Teleopsis dalmanni TaxID=139649 RepID=UPI0018CC867F|nr:solute carrier family 26 member 10-like [Teleopsis dalmanni]